MSSQNQEFSRLRASASFETYNDNHTGFSGWRIRLKPERPVPTPALAGGRVFFGAGFGSYDFFAFDARTGVPAWQIHTHDDGPTSAVWAEGLLAFNTESCTLEVVEAATGEVRWERWLGDPLLAQPAVMDGCVFMAYPRAGEHRLGAFTLREGKPLWETRLDHDVITAPVVAEGRIYLSCFDGSVWCIDPKNGKVDWTQQLRATSAPWVYEGDVYVARRSDGAQGERQSGDASRTQSGEALAAELSMPREHTSRHDSSSGAMKSHYSDKAARYLSSASGTMRKSMHHQLDSAVGFATAPSSAKLHLSEGLVGEGLVSRTWRFQGSRPVVVNGILYDTTGDRLEASEARTGNLLWQWQAARPMEGERRLTPPAVANGRVWAGTWDGRLVSWDAQTGKVRWAAELGAPCHWQPVVNEGWVYAGLEDSSMVAFATGDPLDTGWPMWGGGCGHNGQPLPEGTPHGGARQPEGAPSRDDVEPALA